MGYTDESGIKKRSNPQNRFYTKYPKLQYEELESYASSHLILQDLKSKQLTDATSCIQDVQYFNYSLKFKTNDQSILSLAYTTHDLTNLHLIQKTEALPENGLLIHLIGGQFPGYFFPTGEQSVVNSKEIISKLQCVMATDYHLQLPNE